MNATTGSPLQLRELFHLEVLRLLARKLKPDQYALKGGVNMRFFFASPRYSEDMDLDAQGVDVAELQDKTMQTLTARSLHDTLATFGIARVIPPDMHKAKQTDTTQRFKIHLITSAGQDLFTKIEFSRRGMGRGVCVESVRAEILRALRLPPLMCPHYGADATMFQKIGALAGRSTPQARDVFDLYLLTTQADLSKVPADARSGGMLRKAVDNIYTVGFDQFSDTVLAYFPREEQALYDTEDRWDEIRLIVSQCIEQLL